MKAKGVKLFEGSVLDKASLTEVKNKCRKFKNEIFKNYDIEISSLINIKVKLNVIQNGYKLITLTLIYPLVRENQ